MKNNKKAGQAMALGIVIGTLLGVLTDNIGLWLPIGVALGAGMGAITRKSTQEQPEE